MGVLSLKSFVRARSAHTHIFLNMIFRCFGTSTRLVHPWFSMFTSKNGNKNLHWHKASPMKEQKRHFNFSSSVLKGTNPASFGFFKQILVWFFLFLILGVSIIKKSHENSEKVQINSIRIHKIFVFCLKDKNSFVSKKFTFFRLFFDRIAKVHFGVRKVFEAKILFSTRHSLFHLIF